MPFLSGIWAKIAAVGAIVLAVLAACAKLISIGKTEEREKGEKEQLANVETRTKVDDGVASQPSDSVRDELSKQWGKP